MVQVRVLCQLDDSESACFSGEIVGSGDAVGSFTPGDLVAGFGSVSGLAEVPAADLLPAPPELGPERAVMLPPLTLTIRAARLARMHRGERTLLIGTGSVARLAQVALEASGASVCMLSETTEILPIDGATLAIDTTGDPTVIVRLFEQMPKLARIVLTGPGKQRTRDVDLYRTIHLRGLEVIGVAAFSPGALQEDLVDAAELLLAQGASLQLPHTGHPRLQQ